MSRIAIALLTAGLATEAHAASLTLTPLATPVSDRRVAAIAPGTGGEALMFAGSGPGGQVYAVTAAVAQVPLPTALPALALALGLPWALGRRR